MLVCLSSFDSVCCFVCLDLLAPSIELTGCVSTDVTGSGRGASSGSVGLHVTKQRLATTCRSSPADAAVPPNQLETRLYVPCVMKLTARMYNTVYTNFSTPPRAGPASRMDLKNGQL